MNPQHPGTYELNLERTLRAPVARVWEALTDAGQVKQWYGPGDEFRIEVHEWDCRVGGKYRVAMHHKDGQTHTCFGVFKDLQPNQRLAYTWAWEGQPPMDTLVTFSLTPEGEQTRLTFTHGGFPADEVREQHRMGWTGALERLAACWEWIEPQPEHECTFHEENFMTSRSEPVNEFDGRCAFAVSLGKLDVAGDRKWSLVRDGRRYLFSNPVAKLLWRVVPGRRKAADAKWLFQSRDVA